uniref:Phosphoglycerate mutase n=1 Tax=Acrobeloides nanus TaxID=290746 RepID=A0A914C0B0_9BILA
METSRELISVPAQTKQSFSELEIPLKQPTVFLFRHGRRPMCAFEDDVLLTEEGAQQAIEFGKYLKNLGIEPGIFLSSPFKRCQETLRNIIKGWEIDPNRYLIVDETILGDRQTKYDKMSEIVQKTLKSSTPNQLHLICSHDIMIGDCIRTLFPDLDLYGQKILPYGMGVGFLYKILSVFKN